MVVKRYLEPILEHESTRIPVDIGQKIGTRGPGDDPTTMLGPPNESGVDPTAIASVIAAPLSWRRHCGVLGSWAPRCGRPPW
jgi:hypothetical protein